MVILEIVLFVVVIIVGAAIAYEITPPLMRAIRGYFTRASEHETCAMKGEGNSKSCSHDHN